MQKRWKTRKKSGGARIKTLLAGGVAVALCALGGCTKIREPDPAPPAAEVTAAAKKPASPRPQSAPTAWAPVPEAVVRPIDALPAAPAILDTLNGDPKGLKREEIGSALQNALPSLAPCLQNAGSGVGLTFDASPEGRAQNIKVSGASPETERCVSTALAQVKLPSFEGKAVPLQFPLNVYRPNAPAPPPAAPAAPSGPPKTAASTGVYAPPSMPTSKPPPSGGGGSVFIQP